MSPPILTLGATNTPKSPPKATAHLLPCRVHHNGSVEPLHPFWRPEKQADGTSTSYFRGRLLHGTAVPLPPGYRGVVAAAILPTDSSPSDSSPSPHSPIDSPDHSTEIIDLEDPNRGKPPQGKLDIQAEFDELLVWGHEVPVGTDGATDGGEGYVRGVEEWILLAGEMHSYEKQPGEAGGR